MLKRILFLVIALIVMVSSPCYAGVTVSGGIGGGAFALGDGFIGATVENGLFTVQSVDTIAYTLFTPEESGDVSYAHVYLQYLTSNGIVAVFSSTGTMLAYATYSAPAAKTWVNISLNTTIEVSTSNQYFVGVLSETDGSWRTFNTTDTGSEVRTVAFNYAVPPGDLDTSGSISVVSDASLMVAIDNQSGDPV